MLLILVVLAAYSPTFQAGFIWDDDDYVTENQTLTSLEGLYRIWFDLGAAPQYYPFVFSTFWMERELWGLNPLGYNIVNVLLHAGCAILLWLVLVRLGMFSCDGMVLCDRVCRPIPCMSNRWPGSPS